METLVKYMYLIGGGASISGAYAGGGGGEPAPL